MAATNINIRTDSETKAQAAAVFEHLGLDMSTAVNIFLKQAVRQHGIPFPLVITEQEKKIPKAGCMKGKIWMADDFDAPLEDFKEYM
jgi:DNA-damage-inducible protein J